MRPDDGREPRVLFVEDEPADFELERQELTASGLVFTSRRVETPAQFREAIRDFSPQLIVSDYSLPGADGMEFLRLARELCPGVPFIFVSGTLGEDRAVEALKAGATDYVLKNQLGGLPVRVRRALREAEERRERAVLEERLRQAEKVEVMGRLAGGVAHDFNNLLMIIGGYADRTLESLPPHDARRESLEKIRNASRRGADLTRQLLAFARRQILAPKVIDLNAVISSTHSMLHRVIGEDIDFATALSPDLWPVLADTGQIERSS